MAKEKCTRCGWDWDGEPSKWRRGSPTPDCVCNTCWYSEITELRSPERAARAADGCTEHSFGSNDGQPVDDHCSRCGIHWSERDAPAAREMCSCGSGLPRYEGACPACYSATGDSGERRELAALVRGLRE